MQQLNTLVLELDKLKTIYRKSYITGEARLENSAEHSWHLAVTLLAFKTRLPATFNLDKALRMAVVHDIGEIGAGDVCTYYSDEHSQQKEKDYLTLLQQSFPEFGTSVISLWAEFEDQTSLESRWVRAIDKLLPFILILSTEGKTWREQSITKTMVLEHHKFIRDVDELIYTWMLSEVENAVSNGWLIDDSDK